MNAFVLVTAAWLTAGDAAPAHHSAAPCNDCNACSSCDDCGWSARFKAKLHGWFQRNDCDSGCDSCGHGHSHAAHHQDCGCNDSCDDCGWHARLKAKFNSWRHHNDCGCDSGCGGCGSAAPVGPIAPKPEPIKALPKEEAPKKMPDTPKTVQIFAPAPARTSAFIQD